MRLRNCQFGNCTATSDAPFDPNHESHSCLGIISNSSCFSQVFVSPTATVSEANYWGMKDSFNSLLMKLNLSFFRSKGLRFGSVDIFGFTCAFIPIQIVFILEGQAWLFHSYLQNPAKHHQEHQANAHHVTRSESDHFTHGKLRPLDSDLKTDECQQCTQSSQPFPSRAWIWKSTNM